MSAIDPQDSTKASQSRKVGREFGPQASSASSHKAGDPVAPTPASKNTNAAEKPVRRTPDAEPLTPPSLCFPWHSFRSTMSISCGS